MSQTMVDTYLNRWHALQAVLMQPSIDDMTGEPIYITSNLKVRPVIKESDDTTDEIRCTIFVACLVGNLMESEIQHVLQVIKQICDDESNEILHGISIEINNGGIEIKDMLLD